MAFGGLTANINLRLASGAVQGVIGQLNNSLRSFKGAIGLEVRQDSISKLNALNTQINQVAANSINASGKISKLSLDLQQLALSATRANGAMFAFGEQIGLAAKRFGAFTVAAGSFYAFVSAVKGSISNAINFQREMTRFAQVGNDSSFAIRGIQKEITNLSVSLGVSSKDLAESSVTLRQAGLSATQTKVALESLAKASLSPTFGTMKQNVEGLIASMTQFNIKAEKFEGLLGSINAVSADFAVESGDIVSAIQRTGGAFAALGGQVNELIALFTSVRSTTRESAESIATGLRTIFTRVQREDTVRALRELGINLRFTAEEANSLGNSGLKDQFVGAYEAIRRVSEGLKDLRETDPRFSAIAEELGGYRQISKVIPLIQQQELAQRAYNTALFGTQSLSTSAVKAQESLYQQLQKLSESFNKLGRSIIDNPFFKDFASKVISITESVVNLLSKLAPLAPTLAVIGAVNLTRAVPSVVAGVSSVFRKNSGGLIGYNKGGEPNSLLTPGELVYGPDQAKQIGYANLRYANKSGKWPWEVPGSGDKDSVPAYLDNGSFVLKKKSARTLKGYAEGDEVDDIYGFKTSKQERDRRYRNRRRERGFHIEGLATPFRGDDDGYGYLSGRSSYSPLGPAFGFGPGFANQDSNTYGFSNRTDFGNYGVQGSTNYGNTYGFATGRQQQRTSLPIGRSRVGVPSIPIQSNVIGNDFYGPEEASNGYNVKGLFRSQPNVQTLSGLAQSGTSKIVEAYKSKGLLISEESKAYLLMQQENAVRDKFIKTTARIIAQADPSVNSIQALVKAQEIYTRTLKDGAAVQTKGNQVFNTEFASLANPAAPQSRGERLKGLASGAISHGVRNAALYLPAIATGVGLGTTDILPRTFGTLEGAQGEKQQSRAALGYGLSGAIQSGSIGSVLGAGSGIPGGAIIGLVGGAIYGFATSVAEAKKKLEEINFDKFNQSATKFFDELAKGGIGLSSSGSKFNEDIQKIVERGAKLGGDKGNVTLGIREAFGGNLGAIAGIGERQIRSLATDVAGRGGKSSEVFSAFQNSDIGKGVLTALLSIDEPIAEVNKRFKLLAESTLREIQLKEQSRLASQQFNASLFNFAGIAKSIEEVQDSIKLFDRSLSLTNNLFQGSGGGISVPFGGPKFGSFDQKATLSDIGSISKLLGGESGKGFGTAATSAEILSRVLPSIISEVSGSKGVTDESLSSTISQRLKAVGVRQEHVVQVLDQISEGGGTKKSLAELIQGSGGASAASQKISGKVTQPIEDLSNRAAKAITEQAARITQSLSQYNENQKKLLQEKSNLDELEVAQAKNKIQTQAEAAGRKNQLSDFIPLSLLQSPLVNAQARLTGGNFDAKSIAADLGKVTAQVKDAFAAREKVAGSPVDFAKADEKFQSLVGQANNLRDALKNLTDISKINANIQDRLNKIEQERENRLGVAEQVLTGGPEFRQKLNLGANLVGQAANQGGNISNFGEQARKLLFDFLNSAKGVALNVGGQRLNPEDIKRAILQNPSNGVSGIANLTGGRAAEEAGLKGAIAGNINNAVDAQKELNKFLTDQSETFKNNFKDVTNQFVKQLQETLVFARKSELENSRSILDVKRGRSEEAGGSLAELSKAGFSGDFVQRLVSGKKVGDIQRIVGEAENNRVAAERNASILSGTTLQGTVKERSFLGLRGQAFGEKTFDKFDENQLQALIKTSGLSNINTQGFNQDLLRSSGGFIKESEINKYVKNIQDELTRLNSSSVAKGNDFATGRLKELGLSGAQSNSLLQNSDKLLPLIQNFEQLKKTADELGNIKNELSRIADSLSGISPVKRAAGGSIFSPSGTDTIPAMLSPKEFVVNSQSATANLGLLHKINSKKGPLHLAEGGLVGNLTGEARRRRIEELIAPPSTNVFDQLPANSGPQISPDLLGARGAGDFNGPQIPPNILASRNLDDTIGRAGSILGNGAANVGAFGPLLGLGITAITGGKPSPYSQGQSPANSGPQIPGLTLAARNLEALNPQQRAILDQYNYLRGLLPRAREPLFRAQLVQQINGLRQQFKIAGQLGSQDGGISQNPFSGFNPGVPQGGNLGVPSLFLGASPNQVGNRRVTPSARPNLPAPINRYDYYAKIRKKVLAGQDLSGVEGSVINSIEYKQWANGQRSFQFSGGGMVPGYGSGDSVMGMLTPGEGILTKKATAMMGGGPVIDNINKAAKYAEGGVVAGQSATGGGYSELSASMNNFNNNTPNLVSAFNNFVTQSASLVKGLQNLAILKMEVNAHHTVEMILNGAEVLTRLEPSVKEMVTNLIERKITEVFKKNLPEVGPISFQGNTAQL